MSPRGSGKATLPRLPQRLLRLLGGKRAAYMLGDLNEEYLHFVLPEQGRRHANAWYWRQVARSLPAALFRPRYRRRPSVPGRTRMSPSLAGIMRFAVRGVLRSPRFSLAVVLTLGVGIGAGASIFALVDLLVLRPPPHVDSPNRVRRLAVGVPSSSGRFLSTSHAWIDYEAMRDAATTLDDVAAVFPSEPSLGRGPGARNIVVGLTTPSYFSVLGVRPAMGRFYREEEDIAGINPAPCVASDRFWRRELGGESSALGRELTVGTTTCVVVGITPPGFNGIEMEAINLWMPIRAATADSYGQDPSAWNTDRTHWIRILARLAPGVSDEVAEQDATAAYRSFTDRRYRDTDLEGVAEWQSIMPGHTAGGSLVDISSLLLAGGVVLLLLIAVNLANLFIVRDLGRARETAVRVALGSPRWRLFLDRVAEAGILGLAAGAVGLGIAMWLGPIVRATLVTGIEFASTAVTLRVGVAAVGLAALTGMAIAGASTIRVARLDPAALLASAGTGRSGGGRRSGMLRLGLVGIQAALSVALVVAAIAFINSFRRASGVDLGFDRRDILAVTVPLTDLGYAVSERQSFYRDLWERVQGLPGVASASLGYMTPWWNNANMQISVPGRDSLPRSPGYGSPAFDTVTPDYLTTMRLTMRSGRWIAEGDTPGTAPVVVINEALADLYWPGENPIGRCMRIGGEPTTPCREVVGVAANLRFRGSLDDDAVASYFLPLAQSDEYEVVPRLFVRTATDAAAVVPTLRQVVQSGAPDLPAATIFSLESRFEPLIAPWRIGSYAFTALGLLATIVGTVGLFGILSYVVAERRREFAIRSAIGATAQQIAVPVIRQGVTVVAAGIAVGLALTVVAAGRLQPLLFQTSFTDPLALGAVALLSLTVALLATIAPASDAARRNPVEALRTE